MNYHAVVWLDHRLAKIIGFNLHSADRITRAIHSPSVAHIHHRAGTVGSGHAQNDPVFFQAIADDLQEYHEILLVGPAETKKALIAYLRREYPKLALHVAGTETLGRQTDGEIVEFAREFFKRADRMTPQI